MDMFQVYGGKCGKGGAYLIHALKAMAGIKEVRGRGLMIGLEFDFPVKQLRESLLYDYHIFTGISGTNVIRLLPPLTLTTEQADDFINALKKAMEPIETSIQQ